MSDVNCPYCGAEQEINHDDGYGYDESIEYKQYCVSCDKGFKFETSFSISYEVFCDGDHDMEQSPVAKHSKMWSCSRCDHYEFREEL